MLDNLHVMNCVSQGQAEEWYCPYCNRRVIIRWAPEFGKTIVIPGDEQIQHIVIPSNSMQSPDIRQDVDSYSIDGLKLWEKWMDETGLRL